MVAQVDSKYIATRPWKLWSRMISYLLFEGRPLTTRGQWINPLLFTLFNVEKKFPAIKEVKTPIFILGTGRSGTTVLGIILSMHRDVGFLNEPKALWHVIHPEEDIIGSYSRGIGRYRLNDSDATPERVRAAHRIFGAYLAATFSKRVVDKYPELIFRVPFVKALFPDAKFLFLVRNGWDTCHSIDSWSARLGIQKNGEVHDWWGRDRRKWRLLIEQIVVEHPDLAGHVNQMRYWSNQADMAAVEWIVTMREGLRLQQDFPDCVLRVDYEALCKSPKETLSAIAAFTGLNEDDVFLRYGADILRPVPPKKPFDLHPSIRDAFLTTLRDLGYE